MRIIVLVIASLTMSGAAYSASPRIPPSHAVIFMYHRFGDQRYPTTNTRTRQFAAQLDWLAHNHYQVWPLPAIVDDLETGKPVPDHVVALTVDGAFRSVYEHAYPLLKSRHLPFTVFVSSDDLDRRRADFMTWDQLRDISAHGGNFADDSADSAHLAFRHPGESWAQWSARVRADIVHGQERLQTELGARTNSEPKLFAYPYGEFTSRLARVVNQLGFVAFGQQSGVASSPLDIRAVPRFPINQHYGSVSAFAIRAAALPMPLLAVHPFNPEVTTNNPPGLQFILQPDTIPRSALHCFLNGPPMAIQRDGSGTGPAHYLIQAPSALRTGHDRYNCTALVNGRYYWYSHMWVVPPRQHGVL